MRTVLITGATSGFGKALAYELRSNYRLILTGRRRERLDQLQQELGQDTPIQTLCFDIRDHLALQSHLESLPQDFQQISVLVNNAGLALGLDSADQANWAHWQQMIDTNITALSFITRYLLPLLKQQSLSDIINIGSIAGSWPYPGGNLYGASKAFVAQFSRNLRADLLGSNVRVCNIEPGLAETEFSLVRFDGDLERAKKIYQDLQALTAEDIAKQIRWVIEQPAHININQLEIMPRCQAWGPLAVSRG